MTVPKLLFLDTIGQIKDDVNVENTTCSGEFELRHKKENQLTQPIKIEKVLFARVLC